jgi:hypothetical protein
VSQATTVARLATRELWMTFRLLLVLIVSVGAGAVVGLLPARLPETMARLSAGLGLAIAVAAAVAAWSFAEERSSGRAGWLVTRSVARSTYLAGWYFALVLVPAIGLAAGALLGWLAIPTSAVTVAPLEYVSVFLAVATTLGATVALGLLAGALVRPRAAMIVTLVVCAAAAAGAILAQEPATWLPGGSLLLLARVAGPDSVMADALRAAGIGLALTAVVLVACRVALERSDL